MQPGNVSPPTSEGPCSLWLVGLGPCRTEPHGRTRRAGTLTCWWFRNPARKPPQMYKILWILGYRSYINWWYGKRWQVLYKELLVWIKYIVYTECLETLRFEIELTWITYHPELLSRSNGVVSNSGSCRTRLNLNLYRKRPRCRWLILEYVAHSSILLEENAYLGNVLGYSVPLKDIDFAIVHNLSPKIK